MLNMFPAQSFSSGGICGIHLNPQSPSAQRVSLSAQGKAAALQVLASTVQ